MRPEPIRALVFDLFVRITEDGELADKALHRTLRAHPELHSRERRHVAEATFAMVRLVRRLDALLDFALASKKLARLSDTASPDVNRLRYAAALVSELGQSPTEAALNAGCDGRIAEALKSLEKAATRWPTDPVARLATERSLPDWFAARLHSEYGASADALADALNKRAPLTLRANTLKTTSDALVRALADEQVEGKLGTLSPWAVLLDGHANVFGLKAYKSGLFEVQDEGSQLIALAAEAQPGELVVDACAGGGGKTLALAATMKNKGRILACDVTEARLADVPERTRRAGVFIVDRKAIPADANPGQTAAALGRKADLILVDAPCSGTGSWRRHADARWKLTEAEANAFPAKQREILERFAMSVKPGGRLVYATCALFKAENEAIADAFLAAHPEFEPIALKGLPASTIDARGHLRVAPHTHGTDGFFAAGFKRRATA